MLGQEGGVEELGSENEATWRVCLADLGLFTFEVAQAPFQADFCGVLEVLVRV